MVIPLQFKLFDSHIRQHSKSMKYCFLSCPTILKGFIRDFNSHHDIELTAAILAAYVGRKKMAAVSSISYIMTRIKVSIYNFP